MKQNPKLSPKNRGFTIPELLIATTTFAVVWLVLVAAFLRIGQIFYKAVTITNTQTVGSDILHDITLNLATASNFSDRPHHGIASWYFCVDSIRYTFNYYYEVNLADHDHATKFGLLRDILPDKNCADPFDPNAKRPIAADAQEMLGNHMRLNRFIYSPLGSRQSMYIFRLTTASGDNDVLDGYDTPEPSCSGPISSTDFCAVYKLETAANKGYSYN